MSENKEKDEGQQTPDSKPGLPTGERIGELRNSFRERIKSTESSSPSVLKPADPLPPLTREDIDDRQSDRQLKRNYAFWFFGLLIGQLLIMNIVFIFVGIGHLNYEKWVIELYLGGTLAEVFGIVYVITKNLFPEKRDGNK